MSRRRLAILASGDGSNMQAIAEACRSGAVDGDVALVISNVPSAGVLGRAAALGIPHCCIDHRGFASRDDFDAAMAARLRNQRVDLVILAGFMRILTAAFVRQYCGCLLNIHPSLLPKYPGLNTHQRAIDAGDTEAGCTVHFVIPELDAGAAIIQARVAIRAGDTAASLAQRVRAAEHRIYPRAVAWWVEGRLALHDGRAWLDGEVIDNAAALDAGDETERPGDRHGSPRGPAVGGQRSLGG
jgi:phosphoribosylglycinamide formyltransferase-1